MFWISSSSGFRRLAIALGLGLLLGSGAAGVPHAQAQPGDRCDGAQAAKLLGVATREWQVACWRIEGGRRVIAAVPLAPLTKSAPGAGPLVVRLALAKDEAVVWRDEIRPDGSGAPDLREVLDKSEEWLVGIDDQTLGQDRGVRVGVVGHWGKDSMFVREIALLFRLPSDGAPMRLVWSGLGNTRESRFDYCVIEGIATFQLADDRTLERQIRSRPNINRETRLPRARARALEKKCVAKEQPPQRFTIGQGSGAPEPPTAR